MGDPSKTKSATSVSNSCRKSCQTKLQTELRVTPMSPKSINRYLASKVDERLKHFLREKLLAAVVPPLTISHGHQIRLQMT